MTNQEFENIKKEIADLEASSLKSKVIIEQIEEQWMNEYGFKDLESAKKKLQELKDENKFKEEKRNEYFEKLKDLMETNT